MLDFKKSAFILELGVVTKSRYSRLAIIEYFVFKLEEDGVYSVPAFHISAPNPGWLGLLPLSLVN
jgi:hypothetical protein